jgi:hypothetical protein
MRRLLQQILVRTLIRCVLAISVFCLLLWLGLAADMYSTAPPKHPVIWNLYAPHGWPSPLPLPTP